MRMTGFSRTTSMRSGSVTKYGERYPRSNCMPSTMSSVVSSVFASSTVITPSLPTFSMASAMMRPIVSSCLADAALDRHRIRAGRHVLGALTIDGLGQHSGRGGAVSGNVRRLACDFLDHLRAHVLERILQIDLLCHGHAVF